MFSVRLVLYENIREVDLQEVPFWATHRKLVHTFDRLACSVPSLLKYMLLHVCTAYLLDSSLQQQYILFDFKIISKMKLRKKHLWNPKIVLKVQVFRILTKSIKEKDYLKTIWMLKIIFKTIWRLFDDC